MCKCPCLLNQAELRRLVICLVLKRKQKLNFTETIIEFWMEIRHNRINIERGCNPSAIEYAVLESIEPRREGKPSNLEFLTFFLTFCIH